MPRPMEFCEIARALHAQGFPRSQLDDWVCLVISESSGRTDVIGPPNSDDSRDYGLFQINNRYWCNDELYKKRDSTNDCNIECEELLTRDISAASRCAKKIYRRHGFSAWNGWTAHCQGNLPSVNRCFESSEGLPKSSSRGSRRYGSNYDV